MSAYQYNNAGGYEQYQQAPQSGYDQAYGGQDHYGQQQHDPYGKASNYNYAPEEQKVQGRQVIITYDDDDEVVKQGKKRFNVDERHFVENNIQEGHHGKKHFRVESNYNRTEVQLPKGKRQVQGARGNQSNFMGAISRDHLDGQFENPPNKPKRKTPRPVLLPGESIRHNPTHNSAEQTFHFSKQGDTARWKADLPKKDLQQIKAEKRRLNVAPGEAPSYQPTFNSNISSFQDAISRDDFDGKAEMPQKEIYLRQGKNSKPFNVRPGEALRYKAKSHAHHNNPLGHMDSKEWARELPTKNNTKQVFEPKFPPPRRAHQFSVQLGSDQPNYPKGKYLDQRGKINGKDPKEYTSLRYVYYPVCKFGLPNRLLIYQIPGDPFAKPADGSPLCWQTVLRHTVLQRSSSSKIKTVLSWDTGFRGRPVDLRWERLGTI